MVWAPMLCFCSALQIPGIIEYHWSQCEKWCFKTLSPFEASLQANSVEGLCMDVGRGLGDLLEHIYLIVSATMFLGKFDSKEW